MKLISALLTVTQTFNYSENVGSFDLKDSFHGIKLKKDDSDENLIACCLLMYQFCSSKCAKIHIKIPFTPFRNGSSIGLACGIRLLHIESNVQLLFDTGWLCYFSLCWKLLNKLNSILVLLQCGKRRKLKLKCIFALLGHSLFIIVWYGHYSKEGNEQFWERGKEREEVFDH